MSSESTRPLIVVAQSIGQIGNRLEQFSHLIAFARDHGAWLWNPSFALYSSFFEATHRDLLCRYPAQSAPWVTQAMQRALYFAIRTGKPLGWFRAIPGAACVDHPWDAGAYDLGSSEFVETVRSHRVTFLTGAWKHRYWQNYEAHIPATQSHFRLIPGLRKQVLDHFAPVREAGDVVVGVHIRLGDNFTDPVRRDRITSEGYAKVMRKIEALFPGKRVVFLVCSNESQEASLFDGMTVFRGPGSFIGDMYILAECDYIVGAGQSSFSGWASLMGQKPRHGLFDAERSLTLEDFVVCKGLE